MIDEMQLDSLRLRLASAVAAFARQDTSSGSVAVIGPLPEEAESRVREAVREERLLRRGTPLEDEFGDGFSLIAVTALPREIAAIAVIVARLNQALVAGGRAILEIPRMSRLIWLEVLTTASFGEFHMRDKGAEVKIESNQCELIMARRLAVGMPKGENVDDSTGSICARSNVNVADVQIRVATALERILRLAPGDLDVKSPFSEYGVDSIVGVAFVNELNRVLGIELKPMVLFDHASVERLATFIVGEGLMTELATENEVSPPVSAVEKTCSLPSTSRVETNMGAPPLVGAESRNDIAVVGLAGRFPGANTVTEFWRNLRDGVDSITEVPPDRWDHSRFYDPNAKRPDKTSFKWGGFLTDADKFDPMFFAISGREAEATDPQQRVFLQECYHALEDAGYAGASTRRARKCGVFAGVEPSDYLGRVSAALAGTEKAPLFQGNAESILAARISYFLDLHGPSIAINTACSSSLVAIHLACESLRRGECDLALAGGVRVFASEKVYLALGSMGMLAPDGRCKTFDAAADGFVPGEAAGVVVLKSLTAAQRDRDTIYGVIKGSAINQDGRTNGITAPSGLAQTEVQLEAYERAGVTPESIDYVESHGTGTKLGDPVEVQALTQTYRRFRSDKGGCLLGAVKSNIGHTMAAAGVCSVIKVLGALRSGQIPRSLHLQKVNPYIDFTESPFRPVAELTPWPRVEGRPRRAAVSSYGFSGTNCHLVLEESPRIGPVAAIEEPDSAQLMVFSVHTPEALTELLQSTAEHLTDDMNLVDVAFTLALGRAHFEERLAMVATSIKALRDDLNVLGSGGKRSGVLRSTSHLTTDEADALIHQQMAAQIAGELTVVRKLPGIWREKLGVLGALYVKGVEPDWEQLFPSGMGRRVSLAGYPFARERYWSEQTSELVDTEMRVTQLHPLLHRNTSTFGQVCFTTRWSGDEFFLRDHVVNGQATLPGVAYLEMAVVAARELGMMGDTVSLHHVAWRQPLVVTAPTEVEIRLNREERSVEFTIVSGSDAVVHAEGRLRLGGSALVNPSEQVDITAVQARCDGRLDAEELYARCEDVGLSLGRGMRAVQFIQFSDTESLARLELAPDDGTGWVLPPALLDGALQSTAALGRKDASGLPVPFAVEEVSFGQVPERGWAHVERMEAKGGLLRFRVRLLDEQGNVVTSLTGMSMRVLHASPAQSEPEDLVWLKPRWQETEAPAAIHAGRIWTIGGEPGWGESLQTRVPALHLRHLSLADATDNVADVPDTIIVRVKDEGSTTELMVLMRSLVRSVNEKQVRIIVTGGVGAAWGGYARSLSLEKPHLRMVAVDIEPSNTEAWLRELGAIDEAAVVRWSHGRREIEVPEIWVPSDPSVATEFRPEGVYLITGGAGGLGASVARHLASRFRARIVLMGRSESGAVSDAVVTSIRAAGGEAIYVAADVTVGSEVERALAMARAHFGSLHGVIHAAGVLDDRFVRDKVSDSAQRVLAPKVAGVQVLDTATQGDPLDCFILFSSVAATLGNVGQADYAYANGFMDGWAELREARRMKGECSGVTVSVAWPLWRGVGMGRDADVEQRKLAQVGLRVLEPEEGLIRLEEAVRLGRPRLALLAGDQRSIERLLKPGDRARVVKSPPPMQLVSADVDRTVVALLPWLTTRFSELVKLPVERIQPMDALEKFGIDSVMVMDFTRRLEVDFGELSKTLLFEHQTLAELAEYLVAQHGERALRLIGGSTDERIGTALLNGGVIQAEGQPTPAAEPGQNREIKATDVAIIGVAGRYPMADDLAMFWANLRDGRDCIEEIPLQRWDWRKFYDPESGKPGKTRNKWGGFIEGVEKFDAGFFGVTPREAYALDPQERLFLQTVWQALEDAGYRRSAWAGRSVGVFVGVMYGEYQLYGAGDVSAGEVVPLSSSYASIANRVSYFFDWHGPSLAVDTMCSSSLTAIHLACQSL
ncbi:MAG: SDR family NAD(P)-dependent oxidoreductase, partial [Candidatus Synoicihabitans palmerolidicus]|nr:SDR family NAD(P)-dependent oxidoreductase [Candidatus Synoicihabitans palmerolidicus]